MELKWWEAVSTHNMRRTVALTTVLVLFPYASFAQRPRKGSQLRCPDGRAKTTR